MILKEKEFFRQLFSNPTWGFLACTTYYCIVGNCRVHIIVHIPHTSHTSSVTVDDLI